jgi:hypothetical protein
VEVVEGKMLGSNPGDGFLGGIMAIFKLTRIIWDADDALDELPIEMTVEAEDEQEAVDKASDKVGFCIFACGVE